MIVDRMAWQPPGSSAAKAATTMADYRQIFLADLPLIDVRAPIEYAQGAFPCAVNLPLLTDDERRQVGICYKLKGPQAALALGRQLIAGATRSARIAAWAAFARAQPRCLLYCFRGGLRSQTAQNWLRSDAGIDCPLVPGGYKALRAYLIEASCAAARECQFVVLGGLTGVGKTELIAQLAQGVDLEALANHRGSSFGQRVSAQPGQIDFETRLAVALLKRRAQGQGLLVFEDEGRHVGCCALPLALRQPLECAPMVCLHDAFEARLERILHDYVRAQCAEFCALHGYEAGFALFSRRLQHSLSRLAKRLGGLRHQALQASLQQALAQQQASGDVYAHRGWIATLMRDYYDPMYHHQRGQQAARIVFEGERAAVLAYLSSASAARGGLAA